MTHLFLDSSALIKRYLPEQGTHWVRSLIAASAGNLAIIAHITSVEMLSGISRRKREGLITSRHAHAIRQLMERHVRDEYVTVGLTESIVSRAKDLLEQHPLRAYDAIQLASALESHDRLVAANQPPIVFVTADQRLLEVAATVGLAVDNPNNH